MATSSDTPSRPPKAPSPRKRAAARANGAKGRGRKSEEGKHSSSRNAYKHGLTSATIVLAVEDSHTFEAIRAAYFDLWQPRNIVEIDLLDEMVAAKWRQRRAWTMESAVLELEMARQRPRVDDEFAHISNDVRTAIAVESKLAPGAALPVLLRLEGRLSRQYMRALRTLLELRGGQAPGLEPDAPVQPDARVETQIPPAPVPEPAAPVEAAPAAQPQPAPQQHLPSSARAGIKKMQNEANPDFGQSPRPAPPRFLIRTVRPAAASAPAAARAAGSPGLA